MSLLAPAYTDYEMWDQDRNITDAKFKQGADIKEGVSGKARIDTTYENTASRYMSVNSPNSNPTGCPDPDKSQDYRCFPSNRP